MYKHIIYAFLFPILLNACSGKTDYDNKTPDERKADFKELFQYAQPKFEPYSISGEFIVRPFDYYSIADYEFYLLSLDQYSDFYVDLNQVMLGTITLDHLSTLLILGQSSEQSATCHLVAYDHSQKITDILLVFMDTALDGQLISCKIDNQTVLLSKNVMNGDGKWEVMTETYRLSEGKFFQVLEK